MSMFDLDDMDRRLLHALQIEPRAPWNELADVVGADAATLARRWARLRDAGLAWTTGYFTRGQDALLEVRCELSRLNAVAAAVSADAITVGVDFTSGSRDLLLLVRAPDLGALSAYVADRLGALPGVRSVYTHLGNELLVDGASWRLRALTPGQVAAIRPPRPPRARAARQVSDELRHAIEREVALDGRARIATIAERSGFAPQRVADALATLRDSGELQFRTDMARAASGWPIYAWYFVEAPAKTVQAAKTSIAAVPEVRLAFTAASRYNLILAVWLRTLAEVNRFEIALEGALEGSRIADRAVVMRIAKHITHTIGPDTRATGTVPGRNGSGSVAQDGDESAQSS